MKKLLLLVVLMAAGSFLALPFVTEAQKPPSKHVAKFIKAKRPKKNEYIVLLKKEIPPSEVEGTATALAQLHGGSLMGVFRHAIKGFGVRLSEAEATALANDPRVESVEENAQSEPPENPEQEIWGYQPYGGVDEIQPQGTQPGVPSWGLDRIDQRISLDGTYRYNRTGQGVDAYVLDSGILFSHAEFGGRAIPGFDAFRDPSDPNYGVDCFGHGTHVAGILGGRTYGTAKNVRLYSVRVLDCAGYSDAYYAILGVDWAMRNYDAQIPTRPAVMNISLNYVYSFYYYAPSLDYAVYNAIQDGITVVCAAGNNNSFTGYSSPQGLAAVINVAATDINDNRATFSNFGGLVDLFAPGVSIPSAWISSTTTIMTLSGTSMASPFTAGVAAMYLEAFPNALPDDVTAAILNNATPDVVGNPDPYGGAYTPNLFLYSLFVPPPPHIIYFSAANYTVNEGAGKILITVNRSGGDLPPVTVNYATGDGTAKQTGDYTIALGKLRFGAGETSKTFPIFITDDGYVEGNETVNLTLSNPTGGASLGVPNKAVLTITDNDAVSSQPIDNTGFFVRQQYIDFLNREPDPGGFNAWVSIINGCSGDTTQCDRIHVSQNFFQSEEFQTRGYFVYRFYNVAFGRKPDYVEFVTDLAGVSGFLTATQLEAAKVAFIADFMARPAFSSTYNRLTNQQYVDALLNTAGVTLSSRQSMIDGLNNGSLTRGQVLRQIVESAEVSQKYFNQAFVVMEYFGYLRRQPDGSYLVWIQFLNDHPGDYRSMVSGFVNSAEYRQRFGPS